MIWPSKQVYKMAFDFDFVKMDEPSSEQDVSRKTPVAEDFNL